MMNAVTWFVIVLICVAFGCIAFIVWRKWIAPWRQVEARHNTDRSR